MARVELIESILSVSNKIRISKLLVTDTERWNATGEEALDRSAVLVPICRYQGKLSFIFTVRNLNLSSHKGQVRCEDYTYTYILG